MENKESPTSTGTKNFLKKCRDYISQKFASHTPDINGSNASIQDCLSERGVGSDVKTVDRDKSKFNLKLKDNSFENNVGSKKKANTSLGRSKQETLDDSFHDAKPSLKDISLESCVASKKEMDEMMKQENNFRMDEREKEIIRLQAKVLRLQEKICKLQQKVSTLQGVHL